MPGPPIRPGTPRPSNPPWPAEGTEAAWRAVVSMFRASLDLKRCVIKAWDGDPSDLDPPPDDSPWIRLTPSPLPSAWSNRSGSPVDRPVYDMGFAVSIETSVPGTSATDSMRLWGRIFEVLHPTAEAALDAQLATLGAVGIEAIEVKQPAWGIGSPTPGKAGAADVVRVVGSGRFDVTMHFGT